MADETETYLKLESILASDNVLELLDQDTIRDIAEEAHSGYKSDYDSRALWNENVDKWTVLASQIVEAKNTPWPNASNIKYPAVTEACIQFSSRIYPAIVTGTAPAKGRVIGADPDGQKLESATRISKHMSYQLLEEITEWEEVHDRLGMLVALAGCAFKKTYYCPIKQRNVSELIHPKNFVINYYSSDLASSRRYTIETELHGSYILGMQRLGLFSDVDLQSPTQTQNELKNKVHGLTAPKVDSTTPYVGLEQYCYYDLDGDGIEEPYIITQEKNSKELLRMVPDFNEEGIQYNTDGEVVQIQRKQHIVKYGLLPAPDGSFYDYGFGQYVGPLNHAIDSLFNQLIDAGTLSVRGGGFISKGIRLKAGSTRLRMGEWMAVNATGDDLRKGIFPAPVKEPSTTLLNLATFLITAAQRLAGTIDSMVGENPGQNQKATTTMAVMDQGMKVFSGVYKRFLRSFKEELRIHYRLNKEYLQPEQYFSVVDSGEPMAVYQMDYQREDNDIVPAADPSYTNEQQKLQKAMIQFEMAQNGLIPMEAAKEALIDAHELPNKEQLMQPMPKVPTLDEQKFEDESMRAWTELKLKAFELSNIKGPQARAAALKAIAEAEAVEPGQQMEAMKAVLQSLDRELDREMSRQEATDGLGQAGGETSETE